MDIKEQLARQYLKGNGIEFGALSNPLPVDEDKASVQYADRLSKVEALRLFPELKDIAATIVESDFIIDFNRDNFSSLKDKAFDFIIANHVIEHLVNPIRFLESLSRMMKPQALLFLTVPDKDYTFDKDRALTSNEHLWREYRRKETQISNRHIKEFLQYKEVVTDPHPEIVRYFKRHRLPLSYYNGNRLPLNPFTRKRLYNFHRERSIHVHVWNRASFDTFFSWINQKLELGFDCLKTHNPDEVTGEMIYLLKRE